MAGVGEVFVAALAEQGFAVVSQLEPDPSVLAVVTSKGERWERRDAGDDWWLDGVRGGSALGWDRLVVLYGPVLPVTR